MEKETFLKVYKNNPPNKVSLFLQKNFFSGSYNKTIIGRSFIGLLLISFGIMVFYIFKYPNLGYYNTWGPILTTSFWIFLLIFPLAIITFIMVKLNNKRILKICGELKITLEQYNSYIKMWCSN